MPKRAENTYLCRVAIISLLIALFIAGVPGIEDFVRGFFDALGESQHT